MHLLILLLCFQNTILIRASQWDFATKPAPNATHHLLFDSVSSLKQLWPNVRYRNGHTIVPATIPRGTLLHHGTAYHAVPSTPEWTALDAEFSYIFCHTLTPGTGCWHLTLRTTRELKMLYFDGSSAAKVFGALDSQDVVVWWEGEDIEKEGKRTDEAKKTWAETERLARLCEWGKAYGLDGFVRMQSSFEVMLCDFTNGLEEVSFLNLVSELFPASPPENLTQAEEVGPQRDQPTLQKVYRAMEAGLWHSGPSISTTPSGPAEERFRLDLTRLISFYDTQMFPSLVEGRWRTLFNATTGAMVNAPENQKETQKVRGAWRAGPLGGMSTTDRAGLMSALDMALSPAALSLHATSGVEWATVFRTIKDRYADRLEVLLYILQKSTSGSSFEGPSRRRAGLEQAHAYIDGILTPYIINGVSPSDTADAPRNQEGNYTWAAPIFRTCATTHLPVSSSSKLPETPGESYSAERLLLAAAEGVTHNICRVLVGLWARGVESGVTRSQPGHSQKYNQVQAALSLSRKPVDADTELSAYISSINALMAWLDWSAWIKCREPVCSYEETCYLPTWPFLNNIPPGPRLHGPPTNDTDTSEWEFPQPRCLRRVSPFALP